MKKLLVLFFLVPVSLSAQERYFHELRGMEDSTGTTHLFYRIYEKKNITCASFGIDTVYQINSTFTENYIYRYQTSNQQESVVTTDYSGDDGFCNPSARTTRSLTFFDNHPDSVIATQSSVCCIDAFWTEVTDLKSRGFPSQSRNVFFDKLSNSIVFGFNKDQHGWERSYTSLSLEKNDSLWYQDEEFFYYWYETVDFDSLLLPFIVEGISPYDGRYVGVNEDTLFFSNNKGDSISGIFTPFNGIGGFDLTFVIDSSIIYEKRKGVINRINYSRSPITASEIYSSNKSLIITLDNSNGSHVYVSDSTAILYSDNYGESFELFLEMNFEITGLYKKPNSDILYVLTTDELFEMNTETKAVTSLKKLPVSSEEEPNETPSSIKLHQNYPNPFNPSTTISFELNQPAEVRLTVFDALGRTISVLMDVRKTAGLHNVSFDASNLSSGIYFYRLETESFAETKRFTLIK